MTESTLTNGPHDHDHLEPEPHPGSVFKPCEQCNKPVDTREPNEGGDQHGAELSDGKWVCSFECWDKSAGSLNPETMLAGMRDADLIAAAEAVWQHETLGFIDGPKPSDPAAIHHGLTTSALRDELERVKAERDNWKRKANLYHYALTLLRDCDWVITLPDRMDGVRSIAREAIQAGAKIDDGSPHHARDVLGERGGD
jgi:hypothetical protein